MGFMSSKLPGHPEWVFHYVLGMFSNTFRVMAWCEIMHEGIPLLWEHNAVTCHFNIMNTIILVFCTILVTIHFSQKRHSSAANGFPDLHTSWRFYSSLNTLSMMFLILIAANTTIASIVMTVNTNPCGCIVFPQKEYIFVHDIAPCHNSQILRTFLECNRIPILKWPENSPKMNSIENIWNIVKKLIGNQLLCLKEEMWKRV